MAYMRFYYLWNENHKVLKVIDGLKDRQVKFEGTKAELVLANIEKRGLGILEGIINNYS